MSPTTHSQARLAEITTAAFVALSAILAPASFAAVSLGVTPAITELSLPAGATRLMELNVCNQGDSDLSVRAYVSGIELSPDGTPVPSETQSGEWSCAGWITLDRTEFGLARGQGQAVQATIKIPRGTAGGRYAVVLFEAIPTGANPKPWEVALGTRVGSIVMQVVPRTLVKKGEIVDVSVSPLTDEAVGFDVDFRNTGNVHVSARGSVVIMDSKGRVVDRVPLEGGTGTVLPAGVRRFTGNWSNPRRMEAGDYTGEVRLSCPGMGTATSSCTFSVE